MWQQIGLDYIDWDRYRFIYVDTVVVECGREYLVRVPRAPEDAATYEQALVSPRLKETVDAEVC